MSLKPSGTDKFRTMSQLFSKKKAQEVKRRAEICIFPQPLKPCPDTCLDADSKPAAVAELETVRRTVWNPTPRKSARDGYHGMVS